jgi:Protein of unknown function (DUF3500)
VSITAPGRVALLLCVGLLPVAWTQDRPPPPKRPPAELLRLSIAAQTRGLEEPFKGITADGTVEQGLFPIRSSGVSTTGVREAAAAFLASLQPEQRAGTTFAIDDDEWRKWMNQSFYVRQGVSFLEMSDAQREAAIGLMRAGLSARGLKLSRDIMHLNQTLAESTDNFDEYGEYLYHVTIMGTPSATRPWGWQLDGHHLVINYFVLGDQVVMTPFFTGSEPIHATSGQYKGTSILQDEQAAGLAMVNALDDSQRGKAVLSFSKTGDNNLTEAWKDNVVLAWSGIRATELSAPQRARLLDLVALYVGNMDSGHARVKMDEVRANLDRTWFAWIGRTEPGSVFYYRIHSPVLLVEFDHQRPVARRHLEDRAVPTLEHIHTVVRTPNGNDYGKDLLRQHYALQPHP